MKIIVPFPAGNSPDLVARLIAVPLSESLGQAVYIENRPGAGGIIGTEAAARSAPDGLTLLIAPNSVMTINPTVYKKLPYDSLRNFTPVVQAVLVSYVLVTAADQPYADLMDLLAKAKAAPSTISYGSAGVGSGPHMVMEMMSSIAGVRLNHVPYNNAGIITDLLAGRLNVGFQPTTTVLPLIATGKLRALAVSSEARIPQLPKVPAVGEFLPSFNGDGWQGFYLPASAPKEMVARYNKEIVSALRRPDVRDKLDSLALRPVGNSSEEFAAATRREMERWAGIARRSNIQVE